MPNGLDLAAFPHSVRDFSLPKIRILIEGDCGSDYKNVDEAFSVEVENAPTEATKSDDTSSKSEDTATTENKKTEEKKSVSLDSLDFG